MEQGGHLTAAQEAQLKAELEAIKFFDYACQP